MLKLHAVFLCHSLVAWEEEGTSSWGCSVASFASTHALSRRSGGMPPRKICKNRHQEIEFGDNLASKQASMTLILLHVNFKLLNS